MEKVKYKAWIILLLLTFASLLSLKTYSQIINVNGKITTFGTPPVKYAEVIFINQTNTNKRYLTITDNAENYKLSIITEIEKEEPIILQGIKLGQNYPNPFNPVSIQYTVSYTQFITLKIFDVLCIKI